MSIFCVDDSREPLDVEQLTLEKTDPTLNGKSNNSIDHRVWVNSRDFNLLFLSAYGIEYICEYFNSKKYHFRVITHAAKTKTCFEKANILGGWDPLNVIKVMYFEVPEHKSIYGVVVPETGCFINKDRLKDILGLPDGNTIQKAKNLPSNMSYGTCSPFVVEKDISETEWGVKKIIFDTETLVYKKNENSLDDFSFGMDHRMSIQLNYYKCFKMLQERYPDVVKDSEILTLAFDEIFVREKGKIKINYQFNSLNYRTAKFINSIHGYGDVVIKNDYVDEMDLPDVLTNKGKD